MFAQHPTIVKIALVLFVVAETTAMPINETWKDGSYDDTALNEQLQDLISQWENSTAPPLPIQRVRDALLDKVLKAVLSSPVSGEDADGEVISKKTPDSDFIARWRQQKMRMKLNRYKSKLSKHLFDEIARI